MFLCDAPFISWTDDCTRSYFESLPSFVLVIAILCLSIPFVQNINWPIRSFVTLPEAEAIIDPSLAPGESISKGKTPLWRTICFSALALGETIGWLVIASYRTVALHGSLSHHTIAPFLNALVWLLAVTIPVVRPTPTPPYDLFALYLFQFVAGIFRFGTLWYDRDILEIPPLAWDVAASSVNLAVIAVLLMIVLQMPLSIPTNDVIAEKIGKEVSPEDYTPLWAWITFEWVYPLVRRGTNDTLNEPDVWDLSPTMASKVVYTKFSKIDGKGLLKRLWVANSLDLILDFVLTFVSVVFNYAGPFFLKRILDSLDTKTYSPEARSRAYIYAFLTFLSTVCKAETDVLHLWFGRRASTRIRSGLMASIYAKALVRKDYSGIIDKKEKEEKEAKPKSAEPSIASNSVNQPLLNGNGNGKDKKARKSKKKDAKKDDAPAAGADIGKIVNIMSGDANRICMITSGAYFIYGAPFEIVIASVFLYQLLGLSAFAGFICLGVLSPLNSYLARRSIRIQKGVLAARDKRMGIVNELLNGVKLVKFYGWELRWIDRVLDARKFELKWLVKSRTNSVFFSTLWTNAPICVSVVSFLTYVMTGHELTISVAFTAIALFTISPLNVIPTWIVTLLQAKVSLDRIATFLSEDEVSEEMSSFKRDTVDPSSETDQRLGISHASFKWNEVEDDKKTQTPAADSATNTLPKSSSSSIAESQNGPALSDSVSITSQGTSQGTEDRKFELRDIDVIFPEGKLTVVTGPTASGKSALLMALLGEMTTLPGNGKIHLPKHRSSPDEYGYAGLSYAAQAPFLQHQTIRENILFGTPYEEERYEAVLEACALKPDLTIFEDGDMTEVGSRGISLSGGQKARVALARAVYVRSKCVLLDDPLSAVDSHTALFLYERLLKGPLLANRTVVLVTHNVELVLPGAYYLVRVLDGRIDVQGTTDELREQGVLDAITKDSSAENQLQARKTPPDASAAQAAPDGTKKPRQLVKDEAREVGGVKWSIYKTYMKATSYWTWVALSLGICIFQLLGVANKLWVKQWGEAYTDTDSTNPVAYLLYSTSLTDGEGDVFMQHAYTSAHFSSAFSTISGANSSVLGIQLPSANEHPLFYLGIYAAINFGAAFVSIGNVIIQYTGGLRASKILFRRLLVAVVRATMRWHDSTPTGRMLNRFSKDIETVDSNLGSSLQAVNASMATFFASILTVIFFSPPFVFPAVIIGFVYYKLGIGYLNTGRDLRRMESNSRSPIFSNFSELLLGIVTVRAFSSERRFLDNLHGKIDLTTKMWYSFWMTNRWLLLHFDFLGGLAVLFTTLLALSGAIGAGLAGVTITSAMGFTNAVYWTCRLWTSLELDLNSVERVVEYLELPQEPPLLIESNRPPAYWPSSSDNDSLIVVEDLVVKYSPELPSVLHGVSFSLKSRERVGLLGRTGSGKSTLAMSLLRFASTEPSSGRILIDGIDITTIGLHDLRSRLTLVAQDAVLFSGTIRENIDPFGDYSDEACLDVLSRVHLLSDSREASRVSSRIGSRAPSIHEEDQETIAASSTVGTATHDDKQGVITLDSQVSAGGANFSQGQRQLLTMARALLRQSSIIILDEATSSIDYVTDAKIQKTIREEFKNSLLLTVAHRLRTVIDYDRLIILDNGRVVEFDTPHTLIHKEGSVFRDMCKHSGNFKELEEAANKAATRRDSL
ncbi:hypothetical protein BU17DRAFT_82663 [Hysterangium stoloniferum]|nr:hypothetical protein BU17DRAFT_82663 [Hysterangium stoloniferum]